MYVHSFKKIYEKIRMDMLKMQNDRYIQDLKLYFVVIYKCENGQ